MMKIASLKVTYSLKVFVFSLVAFGIPLIAFASDSVYFQTNDDFLQKLVLSGVSYGYPSSELLYVAKPLSIFIAQLYVLSSNYAWYTIVLMATQGLSILGYLLIIDEIKQDKIFKTGASLALLSIAPVGFFLIFFFSLQYSQTAIMTSGIGTLLLLLTKKSLNLYLGLGLLLIGIFWRLEGGLLALALVLSFYFMQQILNKEYLRNELKNKSIWLILVTTFFAYIIYFVDTNERSPFITEEKRFALTYLNSLEKVLAYTPTDEAAEKLQNNAKKVGWTANDLNLLNKWYFVNKEIYTIDRNLKLAELTQPESKLKFYWGVSKKLNAQLFNENKNNISFAIIFFIIAMLIFKPKNLIHIFFYLSLVYFFFLIILSMGRLPERIILPLTFLALISFFALNFFKLNKKSQKKESKKIFNEFFPIISTVFLYVLVSINLNDLFQQVDQERKWKSAQENKVLGFERVLIYSPDKPLIAFSSFYDKLMKTHSPTKPPSQTQELWQKVILLGWTTRTPEALKKIESLGLSDDLLMSIAEGKAYFATSDDQTEIHYINTYLRQHRNINVKWAPSPFIFDDTGLGIWQIESFEQIEPPE